MPNIARERKPIKHIHTLKNVKAIKRKTINVSFNIMRDLTNIVCSELKKDKRLNAC